eukprot:5862713-Alexandrium_andersonii.AAC.1
MGSRGGSTSGLRRELQEAFASVLAQPMEAIFGSSEGLSEPLRRLSGGFPDALQRAFKKLSLGLPELLATSVEILPG